MKPISELPVDRGTSPRTQQEVQFYTAMRTICAACESVHNDDADDFDRTLLMMLQEARPTITPEDDMPIRGSLLHRLRAIGLIRERGHAAVMRRR